MSGLQLVDEDVATARVVVVHGESPHACIEQGEADGAARPSGSDQEGSPAFENHPLGAERRDLSGSVEHVAVPGTVLVPAQHVGGAEEAARRRERPAVSRHGELMGDRDADPVHVPEPARRRHEAVEIVRLDVDRHHDGVAPVLGEEPRDPVGSLHLGDRVADDEEDACRTAIGVEHARRQVRPLASRKS